MSVYAHDPNSVTITATTAAGRASISPAGASDIPLTSDHSDRIDSIAQPNASSDPAGCVKNAAARFPSATYANDVVIPHEMHGSPVDILNPQGINPNAVCVPEPDALGQLGEGVSLIRRRKCFKLEDERIVAEHAWS